MVRHGRAQLSQGLTPLLLVCILPMTMFHYALRYNSRYLIYVLDLIGCDLNMRLIPHYSFHCGIDQLQLVQNDVLLHLLLRT